MAEHDGEMPNHELEETSAGITAEVTHQRPPIPSFHPISNDGGKPMDGPISQPLPQTDESDDTDDDNSEHDFYEDSDDGVSTASMSSSEEEQPTLQEKVTRNKQRIAQFMESLNEKYESHLPPPRPHQNRRKRKPRARDQHETDGDEERATIPRGMLRSKPNNDEALGSLPDRVKQLLERYPCREAQVRRLMALLHSSTELAYVPPPVFVTGPPGSGKTRVVRDVLASLNPTHGEEDTTQNPRVATAYIDCVTLEPSSIDKLVLSAYHQLRPLRQESQGRPRRGRKRPRGSRTTNDPTPTLKPSEPTQGQAAGQLEPKTAADEQNRVDAVHHRTQPNRAAKKHLDDDGEPKATSNTSNRPPDRATTRNRYDTVETFHSAVFAFGRSLQSHFALDRKRRAVLVVDHGERLLSLSTRKNQSEKTNFLAELLLLPKVMRLNLAIVIISRYSTLHSLRLNNIVPAVKSQATINSGIHPVSVQFPAYKGNDEFMKILHTPNVLRLVLDQENNGLVEVKPFSKKIVSSFLTSLVQYLSDATRDTNDYIRIGRSLWPAYIQPLLPHKVKDTVKALREKTDFGDSPSEKLDQALSSFLGQRFLHLVARLPKEVLQASIDSPVNTETDNDASLSNPAHKSFERQPFLRECLLLAAFVCQNNRQDQDKKIFSIQGNGKRKYRRGAASMQKNEEEGGMDSTEGSEQFRSLRPRPFPVERVFSIFVTLVRLNPDHPIPFPGAKPETYAASDLGSTRLYHDLAQLVACGYVHLINFTGSLRGERISLNGARCWCSLTRDEAMDIAKRVGISLDSYLV